MDGFYVSSVSYSGIGDEYEFTCESLIIAREQAHVLCTEACQFTAWVQGEGISEQHQGRQEDCPICQKK